MNKKVNKITNEVASNKAGNILDTIVENVDGLIMDDVTDVIALAVSQTFATLAGLPECRMNKRQIANDVYGKITKCFDLQQSHIGN